MSFLLRKVSFAKWEPNKDKNSDEFTADAITGCTRTMQNTLSVWNSNSMDFDADEVKDLVVALAITMQRPDAIDLLWLEQAWLEENGIDINATPGDSLYQAINSKHRDLQNLSHKSLAIVGEHIVERLKTPDNYKKWTKQNLIKLVAESSTKPESFEISSLSPKWQEALEKYFAKAKAV